MLEDIIFGKILLSTNLLRKNLLSNEENVESVVLVVVLREKASAILPRVKRATTTREER